VDLKPVLLGEQSLAHNMSDQLMTYRMDVVELSYEVEGAGYQLRQGLQQVLGMMLDLAKHFSVQVGHRLQGMMLMHPSIFMYCGPGQALQCAGGPGHDADAPLHIHVLWTWPSTSVCRWSRA
jgi:hypothetical protein